MHDVNDYVSSTAKNRKCSFTSLFTLYNTIALSCNHCITAEVDFLSSDTVEKPKQTSKRKCIYTTCLTNFPKTTFANVSRFVEEKVPTQGKTQPEEAQRYEVGFST